MSGKQQETQWTSATGYVASTSSSTKYYKKRNYLAKVRKQAPPDMTSLKSGRSIASLMSTILRGETVPPDEANSLDAYKAEQMCDYIKEMHPEKDGWQLSSEVTYRDYTRRRRTRLDVLAQHPESSQYMIIEVKTGQDTEADHLRKYKKKTRSYRDIEYVEHQKQLVFQMRVLEAALRAAGNTDFEIDGCVLYAGGDSQGTTFLKKYIVNDEFNNDAFVGIGTPESTDAVLSSWSVFRRSDAIVPDAIEGDPVRRVVPMTSVSNECPSHCAVTDSGGVVGIYAYSSSAPPVKEVASTIGIVSPCAKRIVVSVD